MSDAAGNLLRLAQYIADLDPVQWQSHPAGLARHAQACLPPHQDTTRYLQLTPRQFTTLNFTPSQSETAGLLRSLAHARRQARRVLPAATPVPAGQQAFWD